MIEFYVTWSWYDRTTETSTVLYRAVLSAHSPLLARDKAADLSRYVIMNHRNTHGKPRDLAERDLDVYVKPLSQRLEELRNSCVALTNITPSKED